MSGEGCWAICVELCPGSNKINVKCSMSSKSTHVPAALIQYYIHTRGSNNGRIPSQYWDKVMMGHGCGTAILMQ